MEKNYQDNFKARIDFIRHEFTEATNPTGHEVDDLSIQSIFKEISGNEPHEDPSGYFEFLIKVSGN